MYGNLILSRRNLLALLHKLDKPGSHRQIVKKTSKEFISVMAEEDAEHYAQTDLPIPGIMTEDTEVYIKAHERIK